MARMLKLLVAGEEEQLHGILLTELATVLLEPWTYLPTWTLNLEQSCHSLASTLNLPGHILGGGALCAWIIFFNSFKYKKSSKLLHYQNSNLCLCPPLRSKRASHHQLRLSVAKIHGAGKLFNNAIYRGFCDDFFVILFWSDTYTIRHHQRSPQNLLE